MWFILMLRSTFELQQEPMRFILVLPSTFELLQEPMRVFVKHQAGSVEVLLVFADQCLMFICE